MNSYPELHYDTPIYRYRVLFSDGGVVDVLARRDDSEMRMWLLDQTGRKPGKGLGIDGGTITGVTVIGLADEQAEVGLPAMQPGSRTMGSGRLHAIDDWLRAHGIPPYLVTSYAYAPDGPRHGFLLTLWVCPKRGEPPFPVPIGDKYVPPAEEESSDAQRP